MEIEYETSVFVSSSSHYYGDRPGGRSYFSSCWSHNRDGHMERRDVCTVSLHIQPVSHFILSFSQLVSHFIASVSRSASQSIHLLIQTKSLHNNKSLKFFKMTCVYDSMWCYYILFWFISCFQNWYRRNIMNLKCNKRSNKDANQYIIVTFTY